jgi:hypothetical protein
LFCPKKPQKQQLQEITKKADLLAKGVCKKSQNKIRHKSTKPHSRPKVWMPNLLFWDV